MALPKAIETMLNSEPNLTNSGIKPNNMDPIIILIEPLLGMFYKLISGTKSGITKSPSVLAIISSTETPGALSIK